MLHLPVMTFDFFFFFFLVSFSPISVLCRGICSSRSDIPSMEHLPSFLRPSCCSSCGVGIGIARHVCC